MAWCDTSEACTKMVSSGRLYFVKPFWKKHHSLIKFFVELRSFSTYWVTTVNMCTDEIDQSHRFHNVSVLYLTIHHFGTEMRIFLLQSGVLWDSAKSLPDSMLNNCYCGPVKLNASVKFESKILQGYADENIVCKMMTTLYDGPGGSLLWRFIHHSLNVRLKCKWN